MYAALAEAHGPYDPVPGHSKPTIADSDGTEYLSNVQSYYAMVSCADEATRNITLALQRQGFAIPVPPELNANDFDRAYAALSAASKTVSHQARTGDEPAPFKEPRCLANGVEQILWGPLSTKCAWAPWVAAVRKEFDL